METGLIFSGFLVNTVFPVLGTILFLFLNYLAYLLKKKWDIEISDEDMKRVQGLADSAVAKSEEFAASYAKKMGNKLDSDDKRVQAVEWLLKKVPELSREDAEDHIMAALNFMDLGSSSSKKKD